MISPDLICYSSDSTSVNTVHVVTVELRTMDLESRLRASALNCKQTDSQLVNNLLRVQEIMKNTRRKSCVSSANLWYAIGVTFGCCHITAILLALIFTGVLNFSRCPGVNGRVCNDRGICDATLGLCNCTDPFFSGEACDVNLVPGYSVLTNQVCSGNGILSAPLLDRSHIPAECREEQPSPTNGYRRSGGGWQTERCFERVQDIVTRFLSGSANLTHDELFSIPLCQCFPPFTGMTCNSQSCPLGTDLSICSGNGNTSVTYTHNQTTTGNGCQCNAQIVKLLQPNIGYTTAGYQQLRQKSIAYRLHQSFCGELITHHTKPDLKLVLTQGLVQTRALYTCRCDALHFGQACEFGVCPEVNGKICNNHGHPSIGIGYDKNTTRNDPGCQPNCPTGQVLCPQTRDCRASAALCEVPATCTADSRFPIRCRDGTCVAKPRRGIINTDYSFGFDETALLSPVKQCSATLYANRSNFLTDTDYRVLLGECAGDEGVAVTDAIHGPVFIPGGKVWLESSLISVVVEFPYSDSSNVGQSLTLSYRTQTVTLQPPSDREDLHVRVALFNESYEEHASRLIRYYDQQVTVSRVSDNSNQVDISPFPTMHDSNRLLPEQLGGGKVVYLRSQTGGTIVQVRPSSTKIEYRSTGEWFIADIGGSRVVIPGGDIVSMSDCLQELTRCVWNAETRVSYDGTRILCGTRTSSTNFDCTVVQPLPAQYIRFDVVLTGSLLTPNLEQYDWQGRGPWVMSQNQQGNMPASDVDFSFDGDFLTFENPGNLSLRRIEFVQLKDLIVPNACPPTQVNASTLNSRWFVQSGRRREGDIPVNGNTFAVGQILHPLKGLHLLRGRVVSNTSLVVRGYEDPVEVLTMREITPSEFRRGLMYEDVHVFPALCADGAPAHVQSVEFHNITVQCTCETSTTSALACECRDHLIARPYTCSCTVSSGGGCTCETDDRSDYLYPVETYLFEQLTLVHSGEADWGICYFHDVSNQARLQRQVGQQPWSRVRAVTDDLGEIKLTRVPGSAALLELYLPCFRPLTGNETEEEPYEVVDIALFGRVSLFSDTYEEVPVSMSSACSTTAREHVLRPILHSYFEDKFDEWMFIGPPNMTVEFKFAPGGVPIENLTLSVSSNDEDKVNVLWNDFTYWRSDEDLDIHPTITLHFNQSVTVLGLYVVLETAGVPVFDVMDNETILGPGVNLTMTIPVELYVEGSEDGGVTWHVLDTIVSNVYRGEDDVYVPFSLTKRLSHLRISSEYPLGISTLMALTNQFCSRADVEIVPNSVTSGSLGVVVLQDIVQERSQLNRSMPCVCIDSCDLGLGLLGPEDVCRDERFVALNEPLYTEARAVLFTVPETLDVVVGLGLYSWMYVGGFNDNDNNNTVYLWSWHLLSSNDTSVALNETNLFTWMADRNLTTTNYQVILWDAESDQPFVTNETNHGYILYQEAPEIFIDIASIPKVVLLENNTGLEYVVNQTLSQRGLACLPGTHCSACGPSNRISPQPLPGVPCRLSEYKESLLTDFENRTNHFYSRASLATDFLDSNGKFSVRRTFRFMRDTVRLSRGSCQDCDGLFRCTTGECVTNLRNCPSPIHYKCPGNGCTRVSVNEKKYSCACDVGWGGKDCSLQYCTPGDPYEGKLDPARWCNCGQFPPIKAKPPFSLKGSTRAITTAQLIRAMGNYQVIEPGDYQSYPFFPSFASFGEAVLRVFLNATTGNPRPVYTTCWFYKRGPFGQPISYFDSAIIDPDTLQVTGWRAFDTPQSINTGNDSFKQTYVWQHPFQYDEFPFRCPQGACVANEDECSVEARVNPPCGDGGRCKVDGTCECFQGKTTFVYTKDWTERAVVPYDAENPVTWGKRIVPLPNRQRCAARDCSDGKCGIPLGCFPGSKTAGYKDAHVVCTVSSGNFGMCGVDHTACRRGEVVPPGPCSYLGLPRQREYRPDEWYCECGELKTKLVRLQGSPSASTGREVTELKKNGWGGPVCENYYCKEATGVVHWQTRDPLTLLPFVDHEQQALSGKWVGGGCGAPVGPNPDHVLQWIACCPDVPHTSWGFARCENVLCMIGSQTQCVPVSKCSGVAHQPMVYPCHGKGRPRADGTCECQTDQNAGTGFGPDESGVGCYKQITCPKARNGRACNYGKNDAEYWTELPKVEYFEGQIPTLMLRMGVIPSYANMVQQLITGPQDMKDLFVTASSRTALRVRDAITALQSCIYLHNATDTNCSVPFGMLPYCGSESVVGPYGKGYAMPYHLVPDKVLQFNATTVIEHLSSTSLLFDRTIQQVGTGVTYDPPQLDREYIVLEPGSNLTVKLQNASTVVSIIRIYGKLVGSSSGSVATLQFASTDLAGDLICGPLVFVNSATWEWGGGDNNAHYCESIWREYVFDRFEGGYEAACGGVLEISPGCRQWKVTKCATTSGLRVQPSNALLSEFPGCPTTAVCCEPLTPPRTPVSEFTITLLPSPTNATLAIQELIVLGYTTVSPEIPTQLSRELSYQNGDVNIPVECRDELNLQRLLGENLDYYLLRSYNGTQPSQLSNRGFDSAVEGCEQSGGLLAESRGGERVADYGRVYGEACFGEGRLPLGDKCLVAARNRLEPNEYRTEDFVEPDCSQWGCYMCPDGSDNNCRGTATKDITSIPKGFEPNWTANWTPFFTNTPWTSTVFDQIRPFETFFPAVNEPNTWTIQAWGLSTDFLPPVNMACMIRFYADHVCGAGWNFYSRYRDYTVRFNDAKLTQDVLHEIGTLGMTSCEADTCTASIDAVNDFDAFKLYGRCSLTVVERDNDPAKVKATEYNGFKVDSDCITNTQGNRAKGGRWRSVYLSPLNPVHYVKISLRAEPASTFQGTDQYSAGLSQLPYLCSRVDITFMREHSQKTTLQILSSLDATSATRLGPFAVKPVERYDGKTYTGAYFETPVYYYEDWGSIGEIPWGDRRTLLRRFDTWNRFYMGTATASDAYALGFAQCSGMGRRILPCSRCLKSQPFGVWEWDQRHYNPQRLPFNQAVGRMNQLSAAEPAKSVAPRLHVKDIQWGSSTPSFAPTLDPVTPMNTLNQANGFRAYAHLLVNFRASRDMNIKYYVDNCVAVERNGGSTDVPYTLNPALCVPQPKHHALCMRNWVKHAVQPGRLGDKCGASCRLGATPQPGRTAFDENALADANRYPDEHFIYRAWLDGTLEEQIDLGALDYKGVWEFLRYTLNESLVWSFDEAREFLRGSLSTRPRRTSPGSQEDFRLWLDFNWKQIWPVDCGVQCSRETGICRPMLAVSSKYCKVDDNAGQYSTTALVPISDFPLDRLPIQDLNATIGVPRCAEMIDPSTYAQTTANGRPSPTNRDFIVLEEVAREHVTLKATRNGLNSWHNTGKIDHLYRLRNDTVLYGTFACSPACPMVQIWAHHFSPLFETNNERILLGNFTSSPFRTEPLGSLLNSTQYRAIKFDFHNLKRYTVVKIGVVLAHDQTTIAECTRSLTDVALRHEEPPASIQLPNTQNECIFEYDADDVSSKVPGQCFCADIAWGGPACESPAVVTLLKGKRVCAGWGRPGYWTRVFLPGSSSSSVVVPVDSEGVWQHENKQGCVCLNPGLIIRTKLDPITRYAYPSIFVSEKRFGDRDFTDKTPTVAVVGQRSKYTFSESNSICASESGEIPWFAGADEIDSFAELLSQLPAESNTVFVDLARDGNSGTIRWNAVGAPTLYLCPNDPLTTGPTCGTSAPSGGLCATGDVELCRSVHHNNLVLNSTFANVTARVLTDGRLDTSMVFWQGNQVSFQLSNRVGQVVSVNSSMVVEVLVSSGTNTIDDFVVTTGGGSCIEDPFWYQNNLAQDLNFGSITPYVYSCNSHATFTLSSISPTAIEVTEVYAYSEADRNRYYNFHQ